MENQDINSIDEMSNEGNMLSDDLFEENEQPAPSRQIVDSSEENTSIEAADKEGVSEEREIPHKEDPSQFEYWQGEADKRATELESFRNQYDQDKQSWANAQREIAEMKGQLNPVAEPKLPPQLRDSYDDPLDEVRDLKENLRFVIQETQGIKQETATERQLRTQALEAAQQKAYTLGEFQKQGFDLEKSNRALNYYSRQRENPEAYYKDLAAFYDWKESQSPERRTNQINQRVDRQGKVLPLGVEASASETKKVNDDEVFFDEFKNQDFGNY